MVKGLLGKKLGMTRMFREDGTSIPVTLVEAGPCAIVQRKNRETDGYEAVQMGYGDQRAKRCVKPRAGHFAKAGTSPKRLVREFQVDSGSELKPGDEVRVDIFKAGDRVDVSGTSKGKGFQGVQKRFGTKGGPASHGSMFHRRPGASGSNTSPGRVWKNHAFPGHMGNVRTTVQDLEVVRVDAAKNLLVLRGAVPGPTGAVVEVKKSVKTP
ncbi:MAG: 50S ribosomal protein L3 [Candidatus Hydrogenedentes bacterium]|nr:50S ribosomal protein L3 [Candidatus Hydrogenedentota bacterium]